MCEARFALASIAIDKGTLGGENVEDLVGVARDWPVVEGKYDFLIGKR